MFASVKASHPTVFRTYLHDLEMPFCLFGSSDQSTSTTVHELGHDYASLHYSTLKSIDPTEAQSRGNEMLLTDHTRDCVSPNPNEPLESYQVYSRMSTIVARVISTSFVRTGRPGMKYTVRRWRTFLRMIPFLPRLTKWEYPAPLPTKPPRNNLHCMGGIIYTKQADCCLSIGLFYAISVRMWKYIYHLRLFSSNSNI